jgi:hypothetical protein
LFAAAQLWGPPRQQPVGPHVQNNVVVVVLVVVVVVVGGTNPDGAGTHSSVVPLAATTRFPN